MSKYDIHVSTHHIDRMWVSYYVKVLENFLPHIKLNLWWNYHILHYHMFVFHATEKVGEFTIKKCSIHFCQSVCQFKYLSMQHWRFSSPFTTYLLILTKTEQLIYNGCDQLHWWNGCTPNFKNFLMQTFLSLASCIASLNH